MKTKLLARLMVLVLLVSTLSIVGCVHVKASPDGYTVTDYDNSMVKAVDRLVALQSDKDFGWGWVVTGLTQHSASPSATNLYGVTALGLLDGYELTGNTSYFNASRDVADFIMYGNASEGDFYNGLYYDFGHGPSWYWWGYSFDYRYLVRFSEVSGNTTYRDYSIDAWNWVKENRGQYYGDGNQTAMYNYLYAWYGTHGATIWQSADFAMAALVCGDTAWAENMIEVIQNNLTKIDGTDPDRYIGWGKALELFQAVDPTTYASDITTLIGNLTNSQLPNGSWGNSAQGTAYALIGLAAVNEIEVSRKGADWLVGNQSANGGWESTEYSEIDSEAAQGLKAVADIVCISQGDLNRDRIVNIADVVIAALAFGSGPSDPNWNPIADLNGDDIINIVDLVRIGVNFGKTPT